MGKVNVLELFRDAMKLEKEGIKFYNKASSMTASHKAFDIFKMLEEDELEHLENLELVYDQLSENNEWMVMADMMDDHRNVIDTENIFNQDKLTEGIDEIDAITIGIEAEKHSIRVYEKALDTWGTQLFKVHAIFDWLIELEKNHIHELKKLKKNLEKQAA